MEFHHPYTPYDIQIEFMNAVYECLEEGRVGILESPTGTGKTLSLICSSLTWLRNQKRNQFDDKLATAVADSNDDPDWVIENAKQEKRDHALQERERLETRLASIRAKEAQQKKKALSAETPSKHRKLTSECSTKVEEDAVTQFLPDDYDSDGDTSNDLKQKDELAIEEDYDEWDDELKVFFCSRTHSQLTQFTDELRKVKFPPGIPFTPDSKGMAIHADVSTEIVKHIALGSRKNLCINPKVSRLGNATAINESCLELQDSKTASDKRCQFLPSQEEKAVVNDFRDHTLASIRDIEDLGQLGKDLAVCPYYASRSSIRPSEVVTLPYPLLLQHEARKALRISLRGHVVIVDEAHNLMDAISGMHSAAVTLSQLELARSQLVTYLQKFQSRLKGRNRVYVTQLVRLIDSIASFLKDKSSSKSLEETVINMQTLLTGKGVDQINFHKLSHYLHESRLARKVDGYVDHLEEQKNKNSYGSSPTRSTPVLMQIQSFMLTLMNPSSEGRFLQGPTPSKDDVMLRYMLLDPAQHFKQVVDEARAVILAGGTMSPMSDYTQNLFPYLAPAKLMTLSCGHVIPSSNLLVCPIVKTANGAEFDFTFGKRNSAGMINNLGETIMELVTMIPDGVVVFFPSYAYLEHCKKQWQSARTNSSSKSIWDKLAGIKPIFTESQTNQTNTSSHSGPLISDRAKSSADSVLTAYSTAITSSSGRGALLFAVVGGTLSEGINFSDRLGRGVAVVGMPFPNPHSAEWTAKMAFVSQRTQEAAMAGSVDVGLAKQMGKDAARDFYTNACMRAVNQAVGRAIRHRGDYASILLIDKRYGTEAVQRKLPGWMQASLRSGEGTREAAGAVSSFFEKKRQSK